MAHAARTVDSDRSSGAGSDQGACTGHLKVHTDPALAALVVYMWPVAPDQNNPRYLMFAHLMSNHKY